MFPTRSRHLAFTLLAYVTLALATSSNAHLQHRDHVGLKRFIKKRSPFPQDDSPFIPVIGAGGSPPSSPTPSALSQTTSPTSTSSRSTASAAISSSTPSGILPISEITSLLDLTSLTGSTTSSTTTSTKPSSTSTSATSEVLNITAAPQSSLTTVKPTSVTLTTSVDPTSTSTAGALSQSGATKKSPIPTILIVVASSVAGITILWTIFRKWKLGRSAKFDKRLDPIDWQPTSPDDDAIPGAHRRLSGSSFHSGAGHGNSVAHVYGADSAHHIPDHDFTAGPAALAPIGGYADLARGSSPQPQMHQVGVAPHAMNSRYDVGVPLHHQAPYGAHDAYDSSGRRY